MNIFEFAYQGMLILCGGIIGTASAILANYLLHRSQKAHDDKVLWKAKLEEFTRCILLVDPWLSKFCDASLAGTDYDETDSPILSIQMLTSLYLPHYIKDVEELEKCVLLAQTTALRIHQASQRCEGSAPDFALLEGLRADVQTNVQNIITRIRKDPTMRCWVRATSGASPER